MFDYTPNNINKFWSKVGLPDRIGTDECWMWLGGKIKGYGAAYYRRQHYGAHRLAYMICFGEISSDILVCHRCDNPSCVNPSHLFTGTVADNVRDRCNKNRTARGIKNGAHSHPEQRPRGERHGNAKLTDKTVRKILNMAGQGINSAEISRLLGLGHMCVWRVVKRETWKHVK